MRREGEREGEREREEKRREREREEEATRGEGTAAVREERRRNCYRICGIDRRTAQKDSAGEFEYKRGREKGRAR